MKECHECGSEMGDVDAFCPFCGISLKPLIVDGDKEDSGEADASLEVDSPDPDLEKSEPAPSPSEPVEEEPRDSATSDEDIGLSETIVMSQNDVESTGDSKSQPAGQEDTEGFADVSSISDEKDSGSGGSTTNTVQDGGSDAEESADGAIDEDSQGFIDVSSLRSQDESDDEPIGDTPADDENEPEEAAPESADETERSSADLSSDKEEGVSTESPDDENESDDFLEDSTIIMSSYPSSKSDKPEETSLDGEVSDEEEKAPEPEELDFEGDTVVQTGAGTKLEKGYESEPETSADRDPEDDSVEDSRLDSMTPEAKGDEISDFSNTESYAKADLEDLKHIPSSEIDEAVSELVDEKKAENGTDDDVTDLSKDMLPDEDAESPESETESPSLELVPETPSESEIASESADVNEPEGDSIAREAEVPDVEPVQQDQAEEIRSETTPNIGVEDTDGSNKTKLKPLEEGIVLNGRYEIVRRIGGGGMGAVYLANDKNLGGVLRAVKEMVQSYIEQEQQEKAVNDFKRESMLLTSLEHPSIPTIYDYFFDEKEARFYLVMKYISGGDLAGRLRAAPEGKLDEAGVVEWGIQIADVLDYLHNRKPPIVYRDLKPANVMIDGNSDKVMLIDFGIARWVNKEEKGVTAVGTMGYAPPELFSGNVEPRSDIYSLGSTMFHLLTGADPQSNPLLIFDFQKHPRPRQINPALSDEIERILMRAVEYNAESRFASASEMRDSLSSHLESLRAGKVSFGVKESPKAVGLAEQPVFCGFCGQKIVATDMFCAFCGAKQPLAQPGVHSEEYVPAQITAKLFVEGTTDLDVPSFSLEKDENLVGRRDPISNIFPEVDLSKYDPQTKISRKHARIFRDGDKFMLEDLNSSNGTVLIPTESDSVRLSPNQSHVLTSGDKIRLGDTTLHFLMG